MTDDPPRAVAWGLLSPGLREHVRRRLEWQRYLRRAAALGYSEREARLVAAGVYQVAQQIPHEVDVHREALAVLAAADFGPALAGGAGAGVTPPG